MTARPLSVTTPGRCICGGPLPTPTALADCTPWCGLVRRGVFSLAQVAPMVAQYHLYSKEADL